MNPLDNPAALAMVLLRKIVEKSHDMAPSLFKGNRWARGNKPGKSEGLLKNYGYYNKALWRISARRLPDRNIPTPTNTRYRFSDGVIHQVYSDGSHRKMITRKIGRPLI